MSGYVWILAAGQNPKITQNNNNYGLKDSCFHMRKKNSNFSEKIHFFILFCAESLASKVERHLRRIRHRYQSFLLAR